MEELLHLFCYECVSSNLSMIFLKLVVLKGVTKPPLKHSFLKLRLELYHI
jgi:hypothetical protein